MAIFSKKFTYLLFILIFSSCINLNTPNVVDFKIIDIGKVTIHNLILKLI